MKKKMEPSIASDYEGATLRVHSSILPRTPNPKLCGRSLQAPIESATGGDSDAMHLSLAETEAPAIAINLGLY